MKKSLKINLKSYNRLVRAIAVNNTAHMGIDTPQVRSMQAKWMRRVRKELPFSSQRRVA